MPNNNAIRRIGLYLWGHKIATLIILGAVAYGCRYAYLKTTAKPAFTTYVTQAAVKGTLITSVTGTGQVANVDRIDLKPKTSGEISQIAVKNGQKVKSGQVLFRLDSSDVTKAVKDAQTSLETAQLALEKLNEPTDELSLTQAQNALIRAQEAKTQAEKDLEDDYDSSYTTVSNAYLNLPNVMSSLDDVLYGTTLNGSQANIDAYSDLAYKYDQSVEAIKDETVSLYSRAKSSYNLAFADYTASSRFSDRATVEALVQETWDASRDIAEAIKKAKNLIDFTETTLTQRLLAVPRTADGHQTTLNSLTATVNTQITSLSSAYDSIVKGKASIIDAERTIVEKQGSLDKLKQGPDTLDVQSQEISIKQREDALAEAKAKYVDYIVTAPFDGVIADLVAERGDEVSTGTVLATIVTPQKMAKVTLNEVDVAQVKPGQKATMTFDALEDFSVTGEVVEIDTFGTSSQGVVTYGVTVSLDSDDDRIKPDMTVSATIITDVVSDALLVPNAAIKTQNGRTYVETLADGAALGTAPKPVTIKIGQANDEFTAILDGLKEGDKVVTKTNAAADTGAGTASTPSTSNRSRGNSVFFLDGGGPPPGR